MIRLTAQGNISRRRLRRRRISNQLAAFAAIMLFASTQVPAPQAESGTEAAPGLAAAEFRRDGTAAVSPAREAEAAPVVAQAVAADPKKSRGLNLSLFLLRR